MLIPAKFKYMHMADKTPMCILEEEEILSYAPLLLLLTTDYGSPRPPSIVPANSYSGGYIRLVALITHMGGHRHKLPPTVAGHIDNTIGYGNGGHSIMT